MTASLDSAYWLGLLISVVLPVLVGLVTTRVVNAGVKATLLLALSTLNGFLVELGAPGDDYSVGTAAVLALVSFATGVLMHFGLYKPTGIAGRAQDVGSKTSTPRTI
ncbi:MULTISPECIES: hypothetical protein [unclassified Streptomyces]|uniref:hypothetical protein n=1 Tax=unclassified Streptomyces TaxID=2593676 RepID=UPI00081D3E87|nr:MULTISPECIES: hypothetical protein [unclassified Streptomyces]MYZ38350.1 hypothetical protein [Streptomyces sp. SID4917]SCF97911.1 hypothetical protein GA0115259_1062111 [Streptomyces sp. MnatMP-M17]